MFVKLLNKQNLPVILNINHICLMKTIPLKYETNSVDKIKIQKIIEAEYEIRLQDGSCVVVETDQYQQLCDVLAKSYN